MDHDGGKKLSQSWLSVTHFTDCIVVPVPRMSHGTAHLPSVPMAYKFLRKATLALIHNSPQVFRILPRSSALFPNGLSPLK